VQAEHTQSTANAQLTPVKKKGMKNKKRITDKYKDFKRKESKEPK
jgi:hypothetical protein